MYKALLSFTTIKPYKDVQKGEILDSDFDTPEEIETYLSIGYIEEYDGSLDITENGTYDVTDYEQVDVNVGGGGGGKYAPSWVSFQNYQGTNLDYEIANLDTSNMTDMSNMFYNSPNLTKLDVRNFNVENVTTFQRFCCFNANLTEVIMPQSNYSSNIFSCNQLFSGCSKLEKLDIRTMPTQKIGNITNMLQNVPTTCLIIVGTDADKTWFATNFPTYTNVKTVAEYEG